MVDNHNNPMKEIRIEKVTLNIGIGEAGDRLEKAQALLERISGKKVIKTSTNKRIPTWGIRPGLTVGVKTTLRGKEAIEVLKRLFVAKENRIKPTNFDAEGNVSFGLEEYIHIPGVKYDPTLGIMGLNICVTLKRKGGNRTKRKTYKKGRIGKSHRISIEEAQEFIKKTFGIEIAEKVIKTYY